MTQHIMDKHVEFLKDAVDKNDEISKTTHDLMAKYQVIAKDHPEALQIISRILKHQEIMDNEIMPKFKKQIVEHAYDKAQEIITDKK